MLSTWGKYLRNKAFVLQAQTAKTRADLENSVNKMTHKHGQSVYAVIQKIISFLGGGNYNNI